MIGLLKLDYHIHSIFSDGDADFRQVLNRALELKMDAVALTDHFDKYDANERTSSITDEELMEHFNNIREYGAKIGQKVLCGIETCTDFYGNLRISDKVIENCDIIITSPHYIEYDGEIVPGRYFDDRYWECYKQKVLNMAAGPGHILGHCEAYLPYGAMLVPGTTTFEDRMKLSLSIAQKYFDDDYIAELVKMLGKSGKALELHCITSTPRGSVIKKAAEGGVSLSLGSDAHALSWVGQVKWGMDTIMNNGWESLLFTGN